MNFCSSFIHPDGDPVLVFFNDLKFGTIRCLIVYKKRPLEFYNTGKIFTGDFRDSDSFFLLKRTATDFQK